MADPAENVRKLQQAYRQWHETKGGSVKLWLDLCADNVQVRSLAAGARGLEFTRTIRSREEFASYFQGLLADWEMINYKTEVFIAQGDAVVMRGSTAWRHRKTGREFDTPKADFWTFRDGRIVEFHEFYDTAEVLKAAQE